MSCESDPLPIFNFPKMYNGDVYYGTGTITISSALEVYSANLSTVEFNFTPLKMNENKSLSAFSWTNPTNITIDSLSGWQFHVSTNVMDYGIGSWEYLMVCTDSAGYRHHLMTGRLELN